MMTTKKFPRTMEEAFGPGNRGGIYETPTPLSFADKIVAGVSGIILFGLLLAILAGVL